MRITDQQAQQIKSIVTESFGKEAHVWLFGSRANDNAKGGDVDILVTTTNNIDEPVSMSAKVSVKLTRIFNGRKVDVVVEAPNIKQQPIFEVAKATGVRL